MHITMFVQYLTLSFPTVVHWQVNDFSGNSGNKVFKVRCVAERLNREKVLQSPR